MLKSLGNLTNQRTEKSISKPKPLKCKGRKIVQKESVTHEFSYLFNIHTFFFDTFFNIHAFFPFSRHLYKERPLLYQH